jgi:hypothetical protein
MKFSTILIIALVTFCISCKRKPDNIAQDQGMFLQNLETFSRLYGYVRWFHPSDEAQEIDWDKLLYMAFKK